MVHGETRSVTIVSVLRPIIPSLLRGFALFSLSFILLSLLNHHRHTAYDVHLLSTDTSETRTSFPQCLVLRFIYCQWPICHCRWIHYMPENDITTDILVGDFLSGHTRNFMAQIRSNLIWSDMCNL